MSKMSVSSMTRGEAWEQVADWLNKTHPEDVNEAYGRPATGDDISNEDCLEVIKHIVIEHLADSLSRTMDEMQGPNGYNPVMARISDQPAYSAELAIIGFRWRVQIQADAGPFQKWTTLTVGGWRDKSKH